MSMETYPKSKLPEIVFWLSQWVTKYKLNMYVSEDNNNKLVKIGDTINDNNRTIGISSL